MNKDKYLTKKIEEIELRDKVNNKSWFENKLIDYIQNKFDEHYGIEKHLEGVYIRGDYDISGSQYKYLYTVLDGDIILYKVKDGHSFKEEDLVREYITLNINDLIHGFKENMINRNNIGMYETLENLARTDFFFDNKEYKVDNKFNQSRF